MKSPNDGKSKNCYGWPIAANFCFFCLTIIRQDKVVSPAKQSEQLFNEVIICVTIDNETRIRERKEIKRQRQR